MSRNQPDAPEQKAVAAKSRRRSAEVVAKLWRSSGEVAAKQLLEILKNKAEVMCQIQPDAPEQKAIAAKSRRSSAEVVAK